MAFFPQLTPSRTDTPQTALFSTNSRGMGMGGSSTKQKKKNKSKKGGTNSKGMGNKNNGNNKNKSKQSTPFDAGASLSRSEKKYEELQQASARALHGDSDDTTPDNNNNLVSEMVVAVKAVNSKIAGTSDWVPVAQLCLQPHTEVSSEAVQAAISLYCRELSFAATLGAKMFSGVPRNQLQYAIEPVDSFQKFVYGPLMEQQEQQQGQEEQQVMTKAQARQILQVDDDDDDNTPENMRSRIKQSYRRNSFQWHPDRLDDPTDADKEHAAQQYARVQKAYEILSSDIRSSGSSWYASLGGRERTDFRTIETLLGGDAATVVLERHNVQSAVAGLDRDLVQAFVTRNQQASSSSSS
ncbi:DnaJ domain [Seminavis robusta]|uniref:DnaJ domain n=1 Tax=Seminavis robusta TaxID=568900 RepID=A0A9N8H3L5_9STRA|nr:DnaJ domain [Seminavis robusta]|eukprot:Sro42_g025400.1 DnaJ domain (354) ;mRNA; r:14998-16059